MHRLPCCAALQNSNGAFTAIAVDRARVFDTQGRCQRTLREIHQELKHAAGYKWRERLLKKNNIEEAIIVLNAKLDDAARSFQVPRCHCPSRQEHLR